MHTVVQESTSYSWVLDRIRETFNLNTKGVAFLTGSKMKLEIGGPDGITFQQSYQARKEFYCSNLLKKGDKCKGKVLAHDEVLTPFGENIIVKEWLDGINPDLKAHIVQTRSHLFTEDRPTLADNQRILCEQMDTLLQEIEAQKDSPNIGRAGFSQQQQRYPASRQINRPQQRQFQASGRTPSRPPNTCPTNMCRRCHKAGRSGPASKTHFAAECPYPPRRRPAPTIKVLMVPTNHQGQQMAAANIQEIQITEELLNQGEYEDAGYDDQDQDANFDFNNLSLNKDDYQYDLYSYSVVGLCDWRELKAPKLGQLQC